MNSNLFDQLGLNIDIAYILLALLVIIIVLLIIVIIQGNKIKAIKNQISRFMKGKEAASLEDEIVALFEENQVIRKTTEKNQKDINRLYDRLASCFQKVGIIKYDAFNQMGGQLSYSIALLDEDNNGFLLNSVHSTDGCYSYSKEIVNGKCKLELGDEEQIALNEAMEYGK
ncbi:MULTISPECIES: DUF4446 family protein [unclassified Butyrivibrio]|uniref:DUF4446 family protein n=1 Tax=unclassified Butyrivibrio TaxID=2639466 RepID=UPI0003B5164D|nr:MULTISPECIES: DUF4446 family protein [unclassified Butyrivibrio]SEL64412.1 Protein of unknown function [Butyrivibrio sp. ob235]